MKIIATVLVLALVAIAGFLLFVYSGIYNVAATVPHTELTHRVLHTLMEQSVRRRAAGIEAPSLEDPERLQAGLHHFDEMCVTCHGAPGVRPSEIGQGLNPEAPDLTKVAQRWTPAELFWIIKHGVKMTGMPAWGSTHSDDELWGIVAVVKRLPTLSPEEYRTMVQTMKQQGHHGHGPEDHRHDDHSHENHGEDHGSDHQH
jgi:mono/diheme cytochrome c family protein